MKSQRPSGSRLGPKKLVTRVGEPRLKVVARSLGLYRGFEEV